MKKLIILISTAFLAVSVIGQNSKNHSGFFSKISKQKELSVPGISDKFLKFQVQNKLYKQFSQLKEADALKQRLDSLVDEGSDKEEYLYDTSGNLILDIYFDWDGMWVKSGKDEYSYDSNGNQTQDISSDWYGTEWVNSWKTDNSYDSNNNRVKVVHSSWDEGSWINSYKQESFYDGDNYLTQNISYQWSYSPDNIWIESGKNEFVYDLNGNQTQNISYIFNNGDWEKISKIESVFEANEKNTKTFVYDWDGENWINSEKYETVYSANENIIEYVYSAWNGVEWEEAAKFEYHYDSNGNRTLSDLIYFFEGQQIIFMREESAYDGYGNRTYYVFLSIDGESEDFTLLPMWKQENVYDNSFSFEDLILPFKASDFEDDYENDFEGEVGQFDLNLLFKHKLTNIINYEHDGNNWQSVGDYKVYYSEQNITDVKDLNLAGSVNVYPNPATNNVTFNIDGLAGNLTVELYDIQGKLVLSKASDNNTPVSIENLKKGLYFYRLSDKSNFYTGKFMVK